LQLIKKAKQGNQVSQHV